MKNISAFILGIIICLSVVSGCSKSSSFNYDDSDKYTMGSGESTSAIDKIDISWLSGKVNVKHHSGNKVIFSETSDKTLNDVTTMRYWLDGSTLRIKFAESDKKFSEVQKTLTVLLPENKSLGALWINSTAAEIDVADIDSEDVEILSVSGEVDIEDISVRDKLAINSISGDVDISAKLLNSFDINSTSGDVEISSFNAPKSGNINTVSGDIDMYLPESSGFTFDVTKGSGYFRSDIPVSHEGTRYVYGDGANNYTINTTSGDISIKSK